ncbi:hypothetical protein ACIG0C_34915 [Kitasatospora aureofaciens]|uniref:Aminoglycoside phosphotransferase domain-containing protein n=1 Tax=Kitasatospora aureofaciens TaxID=1894 RepID=A0A1E7NEA1_KITAU|nr:hypothetical protein [Kitasatospora aureofaciens]ARF83260.1 hypothetical protein B6264_30440 [Kitasatospora aureofaciens]OEV39029.1 hypothetical protein HS99_0018170 [Kitasatospora aureofaciens]GGV03591.1 hypothetical protein GCM10010502_67800 [Kitasatospora aureofaciens]
MTTAPATAAEALTGLARIRPAGWLATPMPTDPVDLLVRARQALAADHPGVTGRVSVLSARYTAAVFAVHRSPPEGSLVLKLPDDPAAYAGETLAYALLSDTAPVARLYAEGEDSLSLLLEYLPEAADWSGPQMPALLVERVVAVLTASLRLSDEAAEASHSPSCGAPRPRPGWRTRARTARCWPRTWTPTARTWCHWATSTSSLNTCTGARTARWCCSTWRACART